MKFAKKMDGYGKIITLNEIKKDFVKTYTTFSLSYVECTCMYTHTYTQKLKWGSQEKKKC